jgi:hypothetical protein
MFCPIISTQGFGNIGIAETVMTSSAKIEK